MEDGGWKMDRIENWPSTIRTLSLPGSEIPRGLRTFWAIAARVVENVSAVLVIRCEKICRITGGGVRGIGRKPL
jgi:hypothetical protein